jgi:hypothetical protein
MLFLIQHCLFFFKCRRSSQDAGRTSEVDELPVPGLAGRWAVDEEEGSPPKGADSTRGGGRGRGSGGRGAGGAYAGGRAVGQGGRGFSCLRGVHALLARSCQPPGVTDTTSPTLAPHWTKVHVLTTYSYDMFKIEIKTNNLSESLVQALGVCGGSRPQTQ